MRTSVFRFVLLLGGLATVSMQTLLNTLDI